MTAIKYDTDNYVEEGIQNALHTIEKAGRPVPTEVTVNSDAFASVVRRLGAKVMYDGNDRYIELHLSTGVTRVFAGLAKYGEIELRRAKAFIIGDVVQLKTGGPKMTVEQVGVKSTERKPLGLDSSSSVSLITNEGEPSDVRCVWFKQLDAQQWEGPFRSCFDADSLEVAKV